MENAFFHIPSEGGQGLLWLLCGEGSERWSQQTGLGVWSVFSQDLLTVQDGQGLLSVLCISLPACRGHPGSAHPRSQPHFLPFNLGGSHSCAGFTLTSLPPWDCA